MNFLAIHLHCLQRIKLYYVPDESANASGLARTSQLLQIRSQNDSDAIAFLFDAVF